MDTYSVVILGASGSGKTVFLASMYKRLSIQRMDTRFFLDIGEEEQKKLNKLYREIIDPNPLKWPAPTKRADTSEWKFTGRVQQPDTRRVYSALQIDYLDYAGEMLTEPQEGTSQEDFYQKIRNADVLLGLLDGKKILSLMRKEPEGLQFITEDLTTILQDMQRSQNPVHFVITKWDLLHGTYSLGDIRKRLLEDEGFEQFVQSRVNNGNIAVRLIPVSSIGMGFAQLQPDGSMKKNPGTLPQPFQVEMPLACILLDQFELQYNKLKRQEGFISRRPTKTSVQPDAWDNVGMAAGKVMRLVRGFFLTRYLFEDVLLERLIEFLESGRKTKKEEAAKEEERLRQEREDALKSVRDEQTALNLAVRSFLFLMHKLETDFPESDLRPRMTW